MLNTHEGTLLPALRIVGNISSGTEKQTDHLLNNGIFPILEELLTHPKKTVRRESCWTISNIAASPSRQLNQLLDQKSLLRKVSTLFLNDDLLVRKEICYVFSNMSQLGDRERVMEVYREHEVIEGVVYMICQDQNHNCIEVGLQALFQMLNMGQRMSRVNPVYAIATRIP